MYYNGLNMGGAIIVNEADWFNICRTAYMWPTLSSLNVNVNSYRILDLCFNPNNPCNAVTPPSRTKVFSSIYISGREYQIPFCVNLVITAKTPSSASDCNIKPSVKVRQPNTRNVLLVKYFCEMSFFNIIWFDLFCKFNEIH